MTTRHYGYVDQTRVIFRETFTGDGSSVTFQLTGNIGNATFAHGAWLASRVLNTMAADVTKTTRAALYDGTNPLTRHKISVSTITTGGLVTLDYAPQLDEDFYVWYWYAMSGDSLSGYYRDDFVNSMESDTAISIGSSITLDTAAFDGLLSAADTTSQKAFDTLDDLDLVFAAAGLTIGTGVVGVDYSLTFNGGVSDGVITWMEDEDYFKFSDDALLDSAEKLYFRDTAIYICSLNDGYLDLVADTAVRITNILSIEGETAAAPSYGWIDFGASYDTTSFAANGVGVTANKLILYNSPASWVGGIGISTDAVDLFSGKHFKFVVDHTGTGSGVVGAILASGGLAVIGQVQNMPQDTLEVHANGEFNGLHLVNADTTAYNFVSFGEASGAYLAYIINYNSTHDSNASQMQIVNSAGDLFLKATSVIYLGTAADHDVVAISADKDLHITAGTVSCYDLTNNFIPYHVSDAAGLADSTLSYSSGSIYLSGMLFWIQGTEGLGGLQVGTAGANVGQIEVIGSPTGSELGGQLILYVADDYDDTYESWNLRVYEDDLWIGTPTDPDSVVFQPTGDVVVTGNVTAAGVSMPDDAFMFSMLQGML